MKYKTMLISALNTMFWSWGSEPQDEIFWAGNELLEWIEKEFNVKLINRFNHSEDWSTNSFNDVIKELEQKL